MPQRGDRSKVVARQMKEKAMKLKDGPAKEKDNPNSEAALAAKKKRLEQARKLEKALDTPAKIYYKYEGVSPSGSHKPNTAVPQAYYNKEEGVKRLTTETGAGQWGSSLAFAGSIFGLEVDVYMVKVSFNQKPYRRALMESFGASRTYEKKLMSIL